LAALLSYTQVEVPVGLFSHDDRFELTKWYADCVSEDGDAVILYNAELRWGALMIHYANLLVHRDGEPARSRISLRKHPAPVVLSDRIEWKWPEWKVEGSWRESDTGVQANLFESDAGSVQWHCVSPRSAGTILVGAGRAFLGWGYVEHVRLTLFPTRLPIRQLRWGRFLNATDALVWIDWRGEHNKQVIYHNGKAVSASTIGDREIMLGDEGVVLNLDAGIVLREGTLGATALAVLSGRQRTLLGQAMGIRECKWLSRAVLRCPGRAGSSGMAIHEVVQWP
jgi:hypothetical protein